MKKLVIKMAAAILLPFVLIVMLFCDVGGKVWCCYEFIEAILTEKLED